MGKAGFGFISHPLDSSYLARAGAVRALPPEGAGGCRAAAVAAVFGVSRFELTGHRGVFVRCR